MKINAKLTVSTYISVASNTFSMASVPMWLEYCNEYSATDRLIRI